MAYIEYFIKIDGIDGESQDPKHKGEIGLVAWSWGQDLTGNVHVGGGGGAGRVTMSDFQFEMIVNKASPKLFLACAAGEHIRRAVFTCRLSGVDYMKIILTDLFVSSFQIGESLPQYYEKVSADSKKKETKPQFSKIGPTNQISLSFGKIEFEYNERKENGSMADTVKVGWDLGKGIAV